MKILWLKTDLLHPVDRGGRIRTYHMLKRIAQRHEVVYLALDDGEVTEESRDLASEYASEVHIVPFRRAPRLSPKFWMELAASVFSSMPYSLSRYQVPAYGERAAELMRSVDLVVCDFLTPATNLSLPLDVPSVLFQHNVEAEIWRRHAENGKTFFHRWFFGMQWRRTRDAEQRACRLFDRVIAVSEDDREHFKDHYDVSDATAVPTGVDIDLFRPSGAIERTKNNIVFVGSMDWLPNLNGIEHFLRTVWPEVHRRVPDATFTIVGRAPPPSLFQMANPLDGVEVTGRVEDVKPYLERAALSVVPLYVGGGTRLKIYEAMAMECPIVSTTIGAEGLPLTNRKHLWLADSDDDLATGIVKLLREHDVRTGIGQAGADHVRTHFSWDAVAAEFERQCYDVVRRQEGAAV